RPHDPEGRDDVSHESDEPIAPANRRASPPSRVLHGGRSPCRRTLADGSAARRLPNEELEDFDARLLAVPAGFRADAAMLVVGRMPLTLLRADAARLGASFDHRPCELRLELGLPSEDVS